MSVKLLSRKLRAAIAKKTMEKEAGKPPECGYVVCVRKFNVDLPDSVYQIVRAPI